MASEKVLEVSGVHTFYDTSHVLFGISLAIYKGEVVCLMGRNGAGKSTTLSSIVGLKQPREGRITFLGQEILGKRPYLIARMGIGMVPQERRIFPELSVRENLLVPYQEDKKGWTIEDVYDLFPGLKKLDRHKGGYLSGGEQQMLAIGRTLMTNPKLLLLDEPGEGLSPLVVNHLCQGLKRLNQQGMTILLAEQNLNFACKISQRAYVIEKGVICFEGAAETLNADEEIKRKYLAV
ncbi:MAG: ABC transporter ATP-binding protein [Thermodesulfobacteriota bacterium]